MITSMTGFGSKRIKVLPFGDISVELRSTNHKFLETVLHLPEGFLSLEDSIKKIIESKVKRGRVTCVVNINGSHASEVFINDKLLKNYLFLLREIKRRFKVEGDVGLDTLIHLPGVLSLAGTNISKEKIWPNLRVIIASAVDGLVKMRKKEGADLYKNLKKRAEILDSELGIIQERFKIACQSKLTELNTDEERSSFLKDSDISEEIERLAFHIKNFKHNLSKTVPVGKELDFIAQEMQREANTIGAKSCDAFLSARVIHMKSQVEKIREQVQNVE